MQLLTDCGALPLLTRHLLWRTLPDDIKNGYAAHAAVYNALAAASGWFEAEIAVPAAAATPSEPTVQAVQDIGIAMIKHTRTHPPVDRLAWTEQDTRCTATGISILCSISTLPPLRPLLTPERCPDKRHHCGHKQFG